VSECLSVMMVDVGACVCLHVCLNAVCVHAFSALRVAALESALKIWVQDSACAVSNGAKIQTEQGPERIS